jgi:hypothetical protein
MTCRLTVFPAGLGCLYRKVSEVGRKQSKKVGLSVGRGQGRGGGGGGGNGG